MRTRWHAVTIAVPVMAMAGLTGPVGSRLSVDAASTPVTAGQHQRETHASPRRGAGDRRADTTADFHWTGHVDAAHWVRVRNLMGWVHVERASGSDVEIRGHKRWHSSDPDSVRIVLTRGGTNGDVLVCALWDDDSSCDEQGYSHHSHHRRWHDEDDQSVDFTLLVPDGIKVLASTVNGDVRVTGASDEVIAESVNGRVEAATQGGPVRATSVNGSVEAQMRKVGSAARLDYSSVNGSVDVTLPADLKADVELSTTNGSVRSDFPISVNGSIEPRHSAWHHRRRRHLAPHRNRQRQH